MIYKILITILSISFFFGCGDTSTTSKTSISPKKTLTNVPLKKNQKMNQTSRMPKSKTIPETSTVKPVDYIGTIIATSQFVDAVAGIDTAIANFNKTRNTGTRKEFLNSVTPSGSFSSHVRALTDKQWKDSQANIVIPEENGFNFKGDIRPGDTGAGSVIVNRNNGEPSLILKKINGVWLVHEQIK